MFVKNLKLNKYRNYNFLDIRFCKGINIIYGDNAQGKTNIIESLFLCSSARSHRTKNDKELLQYGSEEYLVNILFDKNDVEYKLDIFYQNKKKNIKLNGIRLEKIGKLMGNLLAVIFSPESIDMIKSGPQERRRFTDITLSQIKPMYFFYLQQYSKILSNRNKLLKDCIFRPSLKDTIDIWDEALADVGAKIIKHRIDFTKQVDAIIEEKHKSLTNGLEKLHFKYNTFIKECNDLETNQIKKFFIENLKNNLSRDLRMSNTSIGPHRDDYRFILNDFDIKKFGSQGQQRSTVLSLKLAEIELIYNLTDVKPIVLLDDVMSELDLKRQMNLLKNLKDVQVFITTTDKLEWINNIVENTRYFKVKNAQIIES